jgi:tetratricopeptide (TPR) repeat protein
MYAENVLSSVNKIDRLRELFSGPALTDDMTEEQKAQRRRHFNAFNNPEVIGATGCPYDSPAYAYRALTNSVLSQAEIALVVESTPNLDELIGIAADFATGDQKLRDVPAARKMYEYVRATARERGDMDVYLSATRMLAENLALPMYSPQNIPKAQALFSEVVDICRAKDADGLGIDSVSYHIHYDWSLLGLAFCYEQTGDQDKAEAVYSWRLDKDGPEKRERASIANSYNRILNRVRAMLNPRPEELTEQAQELDVVAEQFRRLNKYVQSPLLTKIVKQAAHFRQRAGALSQANSK